MRTINRRQLNHYSAQVVDEVLATGEPVEVVTRGKGSVVISRKSESAYARWVRDGLVLDPVEDIDAVPPVTTELSVEQLRAELDSEH